MISRPDLQSKTLKKSNYNKLMLFLITDYMLTKGKRKKNKQNLYILCYHLTKTKADVWRQLL